MISLDLNIVIDILSLQEYSKMTFEEKEELTELEGIEEEEIFEFLRERYTGIKVSYIEEKIKMQYHLPINVNGVPEELFPCACCNYKTIKEKGNYEICKVCFWEDDGNDDNSKYSHVNHMTLKEAKDNFKAKGAILDKFLKFVDGDGKLKYYKDESLI
ncbi:CPCC family cysteine-rich protein [Chryseobacterium arthrosphaerae]|uniref:CPCC family cysteine-rich protein n=1 Tax=Chryseobacterium arthrosphaerae TaxID=651561 RepID=UPI00241F6F2E|nr:CPCC family cysteine-rich protein [Chryseobacterium arthrosphaerae]